MLVAWIRHVGKSPQHCTILDVGVFSVKFIRGFVVSASLRNSFNTPQHHLGHVSMKSSSLHTISGKNSAEKCEHLR